jgi:hypothetical protein
MEVTVARATSDERRATEDGRNLEGLEDAFMYNFLHTFAHYLKG